MTIRIIRSIHILWGTDSSLWVSTLSKLYCLLSENGSILKGKNLLPLGANSFFLELTPFQKGLRVHGSNPEVTKVVSLVKYG